MDDEPKEIELSVEQKSRLLRLGLDSDIDKTTSSEDDEKIDLLYDVLAGKLPVTVSVVDSLPPILRTMSGQLQSVAGKSIRELLLSTDTDVNILRQIKNLAKQSGTSTDSEIVKEVYLAIYFAAIASALTFHDTKISQHKDENLKGFFSTYNKEKWISSEIASIFQEAKDKL